jgi:site-specific DNA-methyltransferase (adenine-specific)
VTGRIQENTHPPFEQMKTYSDSPADFGNYQGKEFIARLEPVIREWHRLLKPTGNLFLNFQPQTINGVLSPAAWLLPEALTRLGFHIVQILTVLKTNSMPQNDAKRFKNACECVYHAVKDPEAYVVDKAAVAVPSLWAGKDKRSWKYRPEGGDRGNWLCPALERLNQLTVKDVVTMAIGEQSDVLLIAKTQNQSTVHPGKMSDEVARFLVLYGCPPGGIVCDNFCGAGTSLIQAKLAGRHYLGGDLNPTYVAQAEAALAQVQFGQLLNGSWHEGMGS